MQNTKLPFTLTVAGLAILSAVILIMSRFLLADQPQIEDVLSFIWIAALAIVLYKLLVYFFSPHATTSTETSAADQRKNLYGTLNFMFEVLALIILVLLAVQFAFTMTDANNIQWLVPIAVCFLGVMAVPVAFRLIRLRNRRSANLDN